MVGWWRGGISSDPPAPRPLQVYIAAFAVSAYSSTYHRAGCKPFNPVLGETYECERPDRGFRFISEQVRPWKKWAGWGSHVAKAGEHPGFKGPGRGREHPTVGPSREELPAPRGEGLQTRSYCTMF